MDLSHLTPATQEQLNNVVREAEKKLSELIGFGVDLTMVVHKQHDMGEECQGCAVIALMQPEAVYSSLIYACLTMERFLPDDSGTMEISPSGHLH